MDISKVIADGECDADIPWGREGYERRRYAILSTIFSGTICDITEKAIPYKPLMGQSSYDFAAFLVTLQGKFVYKQYEIEVDGKKLRP
jgi:hypothetical protein